MKMEHRSLCRDIACWVLDTAEERSRIREWCCAARAWTPRAYVSIYEVKTLRSSLRRILPEGVRGSDSTKWI
jgi:hypothetical protein